MTNKISADEYSREMFVARLENMGMQTTLTVADVIGLLNDCDYLTSMVYKRLEEQEYKRQNHIDWLNEKYSTGPGELWGGHP